MAKALIIVESPSKIKAIKTYLGAGYQFESSVGHIRDLPPKKFGIDVDNNFEPEYAVLEDKKETVRKLRAAAAQCDQIFLCTDPDREGEAIAWHIAELLPKTTHIQRASFHAITKDAVREALSHPRPLDLALVEAQQARRLLDRMVGYKISPILNRKLGRGRGKGLSAGRVQSVALKLVVDREREIEAFVPVEYWNLAALLEGSSEPGQFWAELVTIDGKRVERQAEEGADVALIPDGVTAERLQSLLKGAKYTVGSVERKEKKRHPVAPFITSTLQQEASRHHSFTPDRTMRAAQQLYEGVELEGTAEGLITYMRTDSVRIEPQAIKEVRELIVATYGAEYLSEEERHYKVKKSAQDAHEAIRPTNMENTPERLKPYLSRDQFLVYTLIWRRFLASQMASAIYDSMSLDIDTDCGLALRATGSRLRFSGFLAVYEERKDEEEAAGGEAPLPLLAVGETLRLVDTRSEQAFTRPPPRFTEALLIQELERSGIGRPSTYAAIMKKIEGREYTEKEKGRLKPTELGRVITEILENNFQIIMDLRFTAAMEDQLEQVAEKQRDWKLVLKEFWDYFAPIVEEASAKAIVPKVLTEEKCPKCGNQLNKIWARGKYFYGCSNYPDCDFTSPLEMLHFNRDDYAEGFNWDQPCPVDGAPMQVRHGRYGAFLGCTNYPDCKGTVAIPKKGEPLPEAMPPCPAIGCTGTIIQRRNRRGAVYFCCSTWPDCSVIGNELEPMMEKFQGTERVAYVFKRPRRGKAAAGEKTAAPKKRRAAPKKAATKKTATKKTATKKTATKATATQKSAAPKKRAAPKKKPAT
jgi:DNA topoisomerase-1